MVSRIAVVALGLLPQFGRDARGGERVEFNRDVRPILSDRCFYCHGPDKNHRDGKLRLDIREDAVAAEAIVPGKPEESELISRIFSDDPEEMMPPPRAHKDLSASQKDVLRRWVEQGAEYQPHWAYLPPGRPELPRVRQGGWARNPVDAFILGTLEARGIRPSPEADRRTLIRRLGLDLLGLPPTPDEVEAFVRDDAPDAYDRLVGRLLASPHFGERMAVPWLDLVRFAETVGYHGDQNQHVFPYRDYVIGAFNRNLPFDRFTAEQLAGDLLPNPTADQRVATGFNRLNMMTREGGAQPKEYLAKYAADRVRTVSITWLGSTMGCAECHDHKFDPFQSRDFYRLAAFFADVRQWGVYGDYAYSPNPELRGMGDDDPFPPEITVASPYLLRRLERLRKRMEENLAEAAARPSSDRADREAFRAWELAARDFLRRNPDGWEVPPPTDREPLAASDVFAPPDGSKVLLGPSRSGESYRFPLRTSAGWLAAIRLELLPSDAPGGSILRNGAQGATVQLSAAIRGSASGRETTLAFSFADADEKEEHYANGSRVLGVLGGWRTSKERRHVRQASTWRLDRPVRLAEGDEVVVTVKGENLGRLRLAVSPFAVERPGGDDSRDSLIKALEAPAGSRAPGQEGLLRRAYLLGTGWDAPTLARHRALEAEARECRDGLAPSMVTEARTPLVTRVLPRGNWQDESGEVVSPGVPHFLPQPAGSDDRRLTRLDLARWITSPENPLTARVFVNRLWKQFFGAGISGVMEDVGAQGECPTHPELLDWLAVEFRESGWDVKHMVTLMVTSATYRQESRLRPELREVDPGNRLLASQSPRRLDAEFVRDNALAIAGLLDPEVGGPSARPYQPADYYEALQFPSRGYVPHRDERQYRRGVYMHWQRTFPHPMLANFDAPSREECTASRNSANSPQQALTLLNDPSFVEAARVLAMDLLASPNCPDPERIDRLFRRALARPARPRERASLSAFLASQRDVYRGNLDDARKLIHVGLAPVPAGVDEAEAAAWTSVCRVVLNLHETITRY